MPSSGLCQDSPSDIVVPPPRTITPELKEVKPGRTIDIYFFDEYKRTCSDTFKVESSRKQFYARQSASFRASVQRKCNGKPVSSPVPVAASFSVRAVKGKKSASGAVQKIAPQASAFSFLHSIDYPGAYSVTVVFRMNEVETHTLSFTINILPAGNNAAASENTD